MLLKKNMILTMQHYTAAALTILLASLVQIGKSTSF